MGSCSVKGKEELVDILDKEQTGKIVKLDWNNKQAFIESVREKEFKRNQLYRLQPDKTFPTVGFLYKVGTLFYEGGLKKDSSVMYGKGLLTIMSQKIEYHGRFNHDQLNGQGILYLNSSGKKLTGKWQNNIPVQLTY